MAVDKMKTVECEVDAKMPSVVLDMLWEGETTQFSPNLPAHMHCSLYPFTPSVLQLKIVSGITMWTTLAL